MQRERARLSDFGLELRVLYDTKLADVLIYFSDTARRSERERPEPVHVHTSRAVRTQPPELSGSLSQQRV